MNSNLIIHIIDTLGRGGAEILLKNSIKNLPEYKHVVVYLNKPADLKKIFKGDTEFICLEHKGWKTFLKTIIKIRKIIVQKKPVLVHSHLFYSNILARFAIPVDVPLVSNLHSMYSYDAFQKNRLSMILERLSVKRHHSIIAVSKFVLKDYLKFVNFKGKTFVHYNFIPDEFFNINGSGSFQGQLKGIAIGNLKEAKNYHYLLKIFNKLKGQNVSLDIIGEGLQREELQKSIDEQNLPVKILGTVENIQPLFQNYNFFIQASTHEGFGLSVIEAMASGVPVLLSDIPVFHEITNRLAHFFPLDNAVKAAEIIFDLLEDESVLNKYKNDAFDYCKEIYNEETHKKELIKIYEQII
jgi:glycosyltransferase involved in cell wall biosynthesis